MDTQLTNAEQFQRLAKIIQDTPEMHDHAQLSIASYGVMVTVWARSKKAVQASLKAFGGRWDKNDPTSSEFDSMRAVWRQQDGVCSIDIISQREEVCTKVEVGRHMETVEVPVTTREEEHEVVDYEWRCDPILETK